MNAYILDTSVLSAFLDLTHLRHDEAVAAVGKIAPNSREYVSTVSLAELRFGVRLVERTGVSPAPELRRVLTDAGKYDVLDVTRHTAEAYGELKSLMAVKYLPKALRKIGSKRIEEWVDRSTGKTLQIDENDLWQCAQSRERDCVFVTLDKRIQRIADADHNLHVLIV